MAEAGIPIYQVDAFADRPFAGNPAAVCFLDEPCSERFLRDVAREMNLSETAFLWRRADGFDLRWFTPSVEVDLCGHATLASAHVLWERGVLPADAVARFHTRSGLLQAWLRDDSIEMDFPSEPATPCRTPEGLERALGAASRFTGRNRSDFLVELEGEAVLRGLRPDFRGLAAAGGRGVIVTCRAEDTSADFLSRFFAPAAGIDEDPVTGSAHCCLAPYWSARLGKEQLIGFQASERGGRVGVRVQGERVRLTGRAVTVLRGVLVPPQRS